MIAGDASGYGGDSGTARLDEGTSRGSSPPPEEQLAYSDELEVSPSDDDTSAGVCFQELRCMWQGTGQLSEMYVRCKVAYSVVAPCRV